MKRLIASAKLLLASSAAIGLSPLAAANNHCPAKAHAVAVSASVFGYFDYDMGAWVGNVLLQIGDQPVKIAYFVDRNTGYEPLPNGAARGTETMSVSLLDGSGTFDLFSRFVGTPTSVPGLYQLHETGKIANGTGQFSGAIGTVAIEGPYMNIDPVPDTPTPFIGSMHGEISEPNSQ